MSSSFKYKGIFTALKAEGFILIKSRIIWILLFLPALVSAIKMGLIKFSNITAHTISAVKGGAGVQVTGYGYLVDGLLISFTLTYLLFLGYSAYSFAIDRERGIARNNVIRSISRKEMISAKYVSLLVIAMISVLITLAVTWFLAGLLWELGPVIEDGYQIIDVPEIKKEIILGVRLAITPLPACIALGLLFSVISRSAIQAVSLAIGAGLILDVLKPVFGNIRYYIFSSFQPSLMDHSYLNEVHRIVCGYSDVLVDDRIHQLNLWVPIPEALFFLIITLIVINRRNL